ncbi:hypothetical protein [Sinanaerobacter chloroacetimidivorans]|uniref:hypothetical protein n=1 Tax=Sinanaerobacter chloroacetimidivorans TaxID=2818044 RepID=UPI001D036D31|nr:hypothetical protein [Sinanaerobacter chloroacetimidivorans]
MIVILITIVRITMIVILIMMIIAIIIIKMTITAIPNASRNALKMNAAPSGAALVTIDIILASTLLVGAFI